MSLDSANWQEMRLLRVLAIFLGFIAVFRAAAHPNIYLSIGWYIFGLVPILMCIWAEILGFVKDSKNAGEKLRSIGYLSAYAIVLIFWFSGIYYSHGGVGVTKGDWGSSIYFSIVTWTTLGYGDIQPTGALRFVAAIEALTGYLYMALLTGSIISLLGFTNKNVENEKDA